MTTISISGAQSAAQSGLVQLRLQQARRNAEQAEQVAQALQAQARDAQQQAGEAQENARSIAIQATQAQGVAGQARQGLAAVQTVGQLQTQLSSVVSGVTEKLKVTTPAVPVQTSTQPVINTQGQTTGTVVNTTA